jgi:hypothetical protein
MLRCKHYLKYYTCYILGVKLSAPIWVIIGSRYILYYKSGNTHNCYKISWGMNYAICDITSISLSHFPHLFLTTATVVIIVCEETVWEQTEVHLISFFMLSLCPFKGEITQHYDLTKLCPMIFNVGMFHIFNYTMTV